MIYISKKNLDIFPTTILLFLTYSRFRTAREGFNEFLKNILGKVLIIFHGITRCCVVLCCVVVCCVVVCCVVLCCVGLCCVVLCCVVLCCVVLSCVVLCCGVLCCVVLCCVDYIV